MGQTQANLVTPQNGPAHYLIYLLQLKTQGDAVGEPIMGGCQAKQSKQGSGCYADLRPAFSVDENFYTFGRLPLPLPGTERETPLLMEIAYKSSIEIK